MKRKVITIVLATTFAFTAYADDVPTDTIISDSAIVIADGPFMPEEEDVYYDEYFQKSSTITKEQPQPSSTNISYKSQVFTYLKNHGVPYNVNIGILANFYGESHLTPFSLQGEYIYDEQGPRSKAFVSKVMSGTSSWIQPGNETGFGLAQWTHYSRTKELYELAKQKGVSIDNIDVQLEFFMQEYNTTFSAWSQCKSIESAVEYGVTTFENSSNQANDIYERLTYASALDKDFSVYRY